ncbi:MAG: right-handed parallel beta-helix repeat-containing protein, partial [Candidatus Krumholzibacteriia bacterium]
DVTVLGMREFYWSDTENPKGFCSIDGYSATIKNLNIENIEHGIYWQKGRLDLENCILRGEHHSFRGIWAFVDGGSIRGCRFEMGDGGAGLSCAYMDSLEVINCVFSGFGYGFGTTTGSGRVDIADCVFEGNINAVTYAFGANGYLRNVTITNTISHAITILYNEFPVSLEGVLINGAVFGLVVDGTMGGQVTGTNVVIENTTTEAIELSADAPVSITNSHILPASGLGVRCEGFWGDFQTLDFTGNYWGTTDPDSIAAMINDQNDDPALQCIVQFEPFADGPVPAEKKSMGSFKSMFR